MSLTRWEDFLPLKATGQWNPPTPPDVPVSTNSGIACPNCETELQVPYIPLEGMDPPQYRFTCPNPVCPNPVSVA